MLVSFTCESREILCASHFEKQKYWCSFFGVVCLQDDYQVCCKLVAHATVAIQSLVQMCILFNAHTLVKKL